MFSKTKNLDKISTSYFKQYANITKALNEYTAREEDINYKHGVKLFGDVNKIITSQINDGLNDLKGNFTNIFENEFNYLKNKDEKSLIKWLNNSKNQPLPKFSSDFFITENYDFINDHSKTIFAKISLTEEHDVIKEVRKCQRIRIKYFNQKKILESFPNSKNKSLLEKCHLKSLSVLENKEIYAKNFISEFNHFIHQHLVFKTYELDIDFLNPEYTDEALTETLCFFNLILNLIETRQIGLHQPYKVFAKSEDFESFDFDKEYWLPILKQFGLVVIDLEEKIEEETEKEEEIPHSETSYTV
jgi:hypothetical protein